MRVVFAGTPSAAVPTLQALLAGDHEVVGVITRPDAPTGRGKKLTPSPIAEIASAANVPIIKPEKLTEPSCLEQLRMWQPDCLPVVAYGALVPKELLTIAPFGWVNLHFSLLPAWRGAAPVQAALLAGDEFTGVSTFQIEEGLDTGPVFGVVTERISSTDTATDLLERLANIGAVLLTRTLDGLAAGEIIGIPQSLDGISHAVKITTDTAHIDWTAAKWAIDRRIRAVTDLPGAWTELVKPDTEPSRIKLGPLQIDSHPESDLAPQVRNLSPGQIFPEKKTVWVGTGTSPAKLSTVQPAGKRSMLAADWARGMHIDSRCYFR